MNELVKVAMAYTTNKPNRNGTVLTNEALQRAFSDIQNEKIPIIDYTNDSRGKVVGVATPTSFVNDEGRCIINHDCFLFDNGAIPELDVHAMINKFHKGEDGVTVIDDFNIVSLSLVKDEI